MKPTGQLSDEGRKVIDEFVLLRTRDPSAFNTRISPEDEMYLYEVDGSTTHDFDEIQLRYFESGKLMLEEYRHVVDAVFGGFDKVDSLLEFACGHGRFTRYLVQEVAPEKLVVSDIYEDAVSFQREQFGVTGIVSVEDPANFEDSHRYQLILVSSLFSHLPAETFGCWLTRLYDLLEDDGVLVFSVHDEATVPGGIELDDHGLAFLPQSESRSLDPTKYGTTIVCEKFVREAIRSSCPKSAGYVRIPKGLWRYQDLYVVARDGQRDIGTAGRYRGPVGYVESCRLNESLAAYCLEGWAFDFDEGGEVDLIEVRIGSERVQVCVPAHPRPDVAAHFGDSRATTVGWKCLLSAEQLAPTDIVSVEFFSSSGRSSIVAFDTLQRMLSAPSHAERTVR